jgi:GcrA cell cycle regulator
MAGSQSDRGCGSVSTARRAAPIFAVGLGPASRFNAACAFVRPRPVRRPSLAAANGHEANMTDIEVPSKNLSKNLSITWTAERVALLRSYANAGLSCAQIAAEIGVTRNAVIGKLNRLGLSRGRRGPGPRAATVRRHQTRPQVLAQRLALKAVFASEPIADNVVSAAPCSLLNLAPRKCRWPISVAEKSDLNFCNNIAADGWSYCAGHARMAYRLSPQRAHRLLPAAKASAQSCIVSETLAANSDF